MSLYKEEALQVFPYLRKHVSNVSHGDLTRDVDHILSLYGIERADFDGNDFHAWASERMSDTQTEGLMTQLKGIRQAATIRVDEILGILKERICTFKSIDRVRNPPDPEVVDMKAALQEQVWAFVKPDAKMYNTAELPPESWKPWRGLFDGFPRYKDLKLPFKWSSDIFDITEQETWSDCEEADLGTPPIIDQLLRSHSEPPLEQNTGYGSDQQYSTLSDAPPSEQERGSNPRQLPSLTPDIQSASEHEKGTDPINTSLPFAYKLISKQESDYDADLETPDPDSDSDSGPGPMSSIQKEPPSNPASTVKRCRGRPRKGSIVIPKPAKKRKAPSKLPTSPATGSNQALPYPTALPVEKRSPSGACYVDDGNSIEGNSW